MNFGGDRQASRFFIFLACVALVGFALTGAVGLAAWVWTASVWHALLAVGLTFPAVLIYVSRVLQQIFAISRPSARVGASSTVRRPDSVVLVLPVILRVLADVAPVLSFVIRNTNELDRVASRLIVLVDFADSAVQEDPFDLAIRTALDREIAKVRDPRISVLFRRRRWNDRDRIWMGWERKRGKLLDFCRLIAGAESSDFALGRVERSVLSKVDAIVTLDLDARLEPGALRFLHTYPAGSSAIVTPRLEPDPAASQTLFGRMFYGRSGRHGTEEPRSFHGDVLGSPLFFGKGLIDVRRFLQRTDGQVPEQRVLSHDHLEGGLARVAHCAASIVLERDPAHWSDWMRRQARWARGDIQLLPFVCTRSGSPGGALDLPIRLKLASNVVGHVAPVGVLAILILAWSGVWGAQAELLALTGVLLLAPGAMIMPLLGAVFRQSGSLGSIPGTWARNIVSLITRVAFLLDYGLAIAFAVTKTIARMLRGRRLLDWSSDPLNPLLTPSVAAGLALGIATLNPEAPAWVNLVLLAWAAAPAVEAVAPALSRRRWARMSRPAAGNKV